MGIAEILLIAIGLALDAFAVSLAAGAGRKIEGHTGAIRLAFHFGLFQFLMPVIGWFIGFQLEPLVKHIDHWIAFILLSYVGFNMIKNAFKKSDEIKGDPSKGIYLVILSIATSIDALVVGFSFAMLRVDIWYPSAIIGLVTASLSISGIYLGNILGIRFGKKMELVGGIILVCIGFKIFISHIIN